MWHSAAKFKILTLIDIAECVPQVGIEETVNCTNTWTGVRLKSKLQYIGNRSATTRPLGHLCYRPAVFYRAFSSAVRQMPGLHSQRRGTARTLPNWLLLCCSVIICVDLLLFVLFCYCVLLLLFVLFCYYLYCSVIVLYCCYLCCSLYCLWRPQWHSG
jgi:hypothetical protein